MIHYCKELENILKKFLNKEDNNYYSFSKMEGIESSLMEEFGHVKTDDILEAHGCFVDTNGWEHDSYIIALKPDGYYYYIMHCDSDYWGNSMERDVFKKYTGNKNNASDILTDILLMGMF